MALIVCGFSMVVWSDDLVAKSVLPVVVLPTVCSSVALGRERITERLSNSVCSRLSKVKNDFG